MNPRTCLTMLVIAALNTVAIVSQPTDEPFPPNTLYVASAGSGNVFEINVGELPEPVTGLPLPPGSVTGVGFPTAITGLTMPEDLAFGPDGLLYVTDRVDDVVKAFDADGDEQATLGGPGSPLDDPTGIVFGPHGGLIVSSFETDRVLGFTPDGDLDRVVGAGTGLDGPAGLAVGPDGKLYVASFHSDEVLVLDRSGLLVDTIGGSGQLDGPWGLTFSRRGHLYVASSGQHRVKVFDSAGVLVDTLGTDALLNAPADVVFGPDGKLYVTSAGNDMLVRFEADGTGLILIDPSRGLDQPRGLAFSPFMLSTSLSGLFGESDRALSKRKEKDLLLGLAPGSGTITLFSNGDSDVLRDEFGADVLVFHGFEDYRNRNSKRRAFHGTSITDDPAGDGIATIFLEVKGKLPKAKKVKQGQPTPPQPFRDEFTINDAKGQLHLAGSAGIFDAAVKAKYKAPKKKK